MTIELKCWPAQFDAIVAGIKTCEIRDTTDRNFSVGDILRLRRWDPLQGQYTDEEALCQVRHIETMAGSIHLFGVVLGKGGHLCRLAVLSIRLIESSGPAGSRSHV